MRTFTFLATVVVALVVCGGGCQPQGPKTVAITKGVGQPRGSATQPPIEQPAVAADLYFTERSAVSKVIIAAVEEVLQHTSDEEAKKVGEFFRAGVVIGAPIIHNGKTAIVRSHDGGMPEAPKAAPFVYLVPVLAKDPLEFRQLYSDRLLAEYIPQGQAILVGEDAVSFSAAYLGFVVLHECLHWLRLSAFGEAKTIQEHTMEEVYAYEMEFRVMSDYGKKPYEDLLRRAVERIQDDVVVSGSPLSRTLAGTPSPVEGFDSDLGRIFGTSKSEREGVIRSSLLTFHAIFKSLESRGYTEEEVRELKAQYIAQQYLGGGGLR